MVAAWGQGQHDLHTPGPLPVPFPWLDSEPFDYCTPNSQEDSVILQIGPGAETQIRCSKG